MNKVEKLKAARALIEKGWTQKDYARSAALRVVDTASDKAVKFCALGALRRAQAYSFGVEYLKQALATRHESIVDFNDDPRTTQADVLALYDRAITLAEKEAARA